MTRTPQAQVNFINCPECGTYYGQQGMARHRKTQHGVAPQTTAKKIKPAKLTVEQRIQKLKDQGLI